MYDEEKKSEVISRLSFLIKKEFEISNSSNVIVDYVFETPTQVKLLKKKIGDKFKIYDFYFKCPESIIENRIIFRDNLNVKWELNRFKEILSVQQPFIESGSLGKVIDCSKEVSLIVNEIISTIK